MAYARIFTSPALPTTLKPSCFSPSNNNYKLKSVDNVYTRSRTNICCIYQEYKDIIKQEGKELRLAVTPTSPEEDLKVLRRYPNIRPDELHQRDFPDNFLFGVGTSAIQIEGNGTEGGRGPSTGDYMIHADQGGKGVDSYNKFKEDVALLKEMNIPVYRFSISWPRILPEGTIDKINPEGVKYYNKLLDELEKNDIQPFVTLFHFDQPKALQTRYNGFLDRRIIKDFTDYCDLCFRLFGDRVKSWITINEASTFILFTDCCLNEEQRKDPLNQFIANHNILLCHASVAKLYREKYKSTQKGEVGMAIVSKWFKPSQPDSEMDQEAAKLSFDFLMGWYMDPLTKGDYPESMKKWVPGLPKFSEEESNDIKGSSDFFGINYYTSAYTSMVPNGQTLIKDKVTDLRYLIVEKDERDGERIGPEAYGQYQINVHPDGLLKLLEKVQKDYDNHKMYITENGCSSHSKIRTSIKDGYATERFGHIVKEINDEQRLEYFQLHLYEVYEAQRKGINVQGYIFWSLMDNCEFGNYDVRFGLSYVDYYDDYKRHLKKSGKWYAQFLNKKWFLGKRQPSEHPETVIPLN